MTIHKPILPRQIRQAPIGKALSLPSPRSFRQTKETARLIHNFAFRFGTPGTSSPTSALSACSRFNTAVSGIGRRRQNAGDKKISSSGNGGGSSLSPGRLLTPESAPPAPAIFVPASTRFLSESRSALGCSQIRGSEASGLARHGKVARQLKVPSSIIVPPCGLR
jgi:hypothetical protein